MRSYAGKTARIQDFEQLAEVASGAAGARGDSRLGNAPAAVRGAGQPAPVLHAVAAFDGRSGIQPGIRDLPHEEGIPDRRQGQAESGFLPHGCARSKSRPREIPNSRPSPFPEKNPRSRWKHSGGPKPNGIIIDPHDYILKSSQRLRVRGIIARGESLAEQGRYYDAVQQYQRALELDRSNALADFRMGEAFFYQRNYAASAQSFRDALDGATDLTRNGPKCGRTFIWEGFTTSRATARAPSTNTARPSRPATTPAARKPKRKNP